MYKISYPKLSPSYATMTPAGKATGQQRYKLIHILPKTENPLKAFDTMHCMFCVTYALDGIQISSRNFSCETRTCPSFPVRFQFGDNFLLKKHAVVYGEAYFMYQIQISQ